MRLPKIHAYTIKSKQTCDKSWKDPYSDKHDGLKQNYCAINFKIPIYYNYYKNITIQGVNLILRDNKCWFQIATFSHRFPLAEQRQHNAFYILLSIAFSGFFLIGLKMATREPCLKHYHPKHKLRFLEGATWPQPPVVWALRLTLCLELVNSYVRLPHWNYLLCDGTGWGWGYLH